MQPIDAIKINACFDVNMMCEREAIVNTENDLSPFRPAVIS